MNTYFSKQKYIIKDYNLMNNLDMSGGATEQNSYANFNEQQGEIVNRQIALLEETKAKQTQIIKSLQEQTPDEPEQSTPDPSEKQQPTEEIQQQFKEKFEKKFEEKFEEKLQQVKDGIIQLSEKDNILLERFKQKLQEHISSQVSSQESSQESSYKDTSEDMMSEIYKLFRLLFKKKIINQ